MGDLSSDTELRGAAGEWHVELNPDWEIWGLNGGYLAAVALRAIGRHSALARPASLACHYLAVARPGEVVVRARTLRASRRAESVEVSLTQDGRQVLAALGWVVADHIDGLTFDGAPAPRVPPPEQLASVEELAGEDSASSRPDHAFFANIEQRPTAWLDREHWEARESLEPEMCSWVRFRPVACFEDPFVDAARSVVLLDTFGWPAATRAQRQDQMSHVAPSLDVAVAFHRIEQRSEWLLLRASSPAAADGLVGGSGAVWSEEGRLLATATQQMLCRPVPRGAAG